MAISFVSIILSIIPFGCRYKTFPPKISWLTLSLYGQLIQLVSFYLLGFGYKNASGIGVFVGLDLSDTIELTWRMAFTSIVGLGKADPKLQVLYINLVPLLLLWLLEKAKAVRETSANMLFAK